MTFITHRGISKVCRRDISQSRKSQENLYPICLRGSQGGSNIVQGGGGFSRQKWFRSQKKIFKSPHVRNAGNNKKYIYSV